MAEGSEKGEAADLIPGGSRADLLRQVCEHADFEATAKYSQYFERTDDDENDVGEDRRADDVTQDNIR